MEKASGVYLTITDNSFIAQAGAQSMRVIVPMLTTKGKLGFNRVTANDFKDIVGYDLEYNSNYLGLSRILEYVSYVDVWRLNQESKLANAYFLTKTSDKEYVADAESIEDVTMMDPAPLLAVGNKSTGDWQTSAIKINPLHSETTQQNTNGTAVDPQIIKLNPVNKTEETKIGDISVLNGLLLYNSSDNAIVGAIKKNILDEYKLYRVVDGELIDDVIFIQETDTWKDGSKFYDSAMQEITEPEGDASEPVDIGVVRQSTYQRTNSVWKMGDSFISSEFAPTIEPQGTASSPVNLCKAFAENGSHTHLVAGTIYATNDSGTTYYTVTKLGATWNDCVKVEIDASETDVLTELSSIYGADEFSEIDYIQYSETLATGMYRNISDSWFKVKALLQSSIVTEGMREENPAIVAALEAASDETIQYIKYTEETFTTDNSVGTVEFNLDSTILTITTPPSKDSFWNIHTLPEVLTDWTLTLASYDGRNYSVKKTYNFSTDLESEIYVENVDFGDLFVQVNGSIPSDMTSIRNYFTLEGGSNGNDSLIATNIDTSILDNCGRNIMAMNGLTDYKVVNRIAGKIKENKIHVFADAPAYSSYIDVETWEKKLAKSEYLATGSRPDKVQISEDSYVYVYPSVNYVYILSQMLSNFGSLNFPPAGPTYGLINTEELIECDYEMYADELKTNRINWQRTNNVGTMMWEQRTTYELNTDLSYIAPVFIVDAVAEDVVTFEQQFNFRYMTPTDILNQDSGLTSILQDYVDKGFLYSFNLHMPTYEEAQKAGRTLVIPIEIVTTKDAEVIKINLILNNAA